MGDLCLCQDPDFDHSVREAVLSEVGLKGRILVVDDERDIRAMLSGILQDEEHEVECAPDIASGEALLREKNFDLCMLDVWLPDGDGVAALASLRSIQPNCQFIMISGHASIEVAVRATQEGAFDFLEKPLGLEKVLQSVQNALRLSLLREENRSLRVRLEEKYQLIGESSCVMKIKAQIARIARTHATVLVTGENGTGKENVSRCIHAGSQRASGPFVAVNCAAIPDELIESELFGHEKGAFTGATSTYRGQFERAHRGTLLLDEIGDMSLRTQSKVLRALQDQTICRLGGTKSIQVDVRVIAATNKVLEEEIRAGRFREDLYYRLNVLPLHLPPLRERGADIELLAKHFLSYFVRENGSGPSHFSADSLELLRQHTWPGNVRELKNLMERLSILTFGEEVRVEDLEASGLRSQQTTGGSKLEEILLIENFRQAKNAFEKAFLEHKLRECGANVARTAERIGVERTHLHRKLRQLGVGPEGF